MSAALVMSTDVVSAGDRAPQWREWVWRHFGGLESDLYGDTAFDGHMTAVQAGDVVMTRLRANRHRVLRTPTTARTTEAAYLKIVAPWQGSASVRQLGREAVVTPGAWAIYDTTGTYQIDNPVRAEHLIVLDITDDGRAVGKAAKRIRRDELVVGQAVETIAPAGGVEPQEMILEALKIGRPELPYGSRPARPMRGLAMHVALLVGSSPSRSSTEQILALHHKYQVRQARHALSEVDG